VIGARRDGTKRFSGKEEHHIAMPGWNKELASLRQSDEATKELLRLCDDRFKSGARAYDRILKVARTIAEPRPGSENITSDHISEAIQYRSLDRQLWT
jgi:magnesium chelatase family protein